MPLEMDSGRTSGPFPRDDDAVCLQVDILNEVQSYLDLSKVDWKAGRVSGCIYSPNEAESEKLVEEVGSPSFEMSTFELIYPGLPRTSRNADIDSLNYLVLLIFLKVFRKTMKSNHLHADVFSGIRKMEAEIIRWVLRLYNGDSASCGSVSIRQ